MLSREEAWESWLDRGADDEVSDLVDKIYDSIGSCTDCKFLGDRKIFCGEHGFFVPSNGYCLKFERKDDAT